MAVSLAKTSLLMSNLLKSNIIFNRLVLPLNYNGVKRIQTTVRLLMPTRLAAIGLNMVKQRSLPHANYATTFSQHCWKCKETLIPERDQYFCICGIIQPPHPERSYFRVFGLEEDFDIDTKALNLSFRRLQSKLHPDKFEQKSQVLMLMNSAI